jgi:uncharacterized protein
MTNKLLAGLQDYALSVFGCGHCSIHGPVHWRNVDDAGMLICRESTADLLVVRFFAYLHDARRLDDGSDCEHGPRSAARLGELPEHLDVLSAEQRELLAHAICRHTDGDTTDEPTVGACWDADRLDLGRVGIIPSARYMSTQPGKDIAALGSRRLYMDKSRRAGECRL